MSSFIIIVILSVLGLVSSSNSPLLPCNAINTTTIDYQQLIDLSPFNMYNTSGICAKVVFTGPGYSQTSYTGSALVITGNLTNSYDINLVNETQMNAIVCSSGFKHSYNVVYNNLISPTAASACSINCAANGIDYADVMCIGRGANDYEAIKAFLAAKVPTALNITNAQQRCPLPQYCNFFTN